MIFWSLSNFVSINQVASSDGFGLCLILGMIICTNSIKFEIYLLFKIFVYQEFKIQPFILFFPVYWHKLNNQEHKKTHNSRKWTRTLTLLPLHSFILSRPEDVNRYISEEMIGFDRRGAKIYRGTMFPYGYLPVCIAYKMAFVKKINQSRIARTLI